MTDISLIRAGHSQVADGQCGLCDVPWPCDVGVVLAALDAEQRARYEVDVSTGPRVMIDLTSGEIESLTKQLAAAEARAEQAERERDASVKARMDWQADYDREKRQHHARLDAIRSRLATVEAALLHRCVVQRVDPTCEDCQTIIAALAATPAAETDGFDPTAPRVRFENVAEVVEWLTSDDDAATPAAGEVTT